MTTGLVDATAITLETLVIAMTAATLWSIFCWWLGIPSSSTHALIGGIVGAAWSIHGWEAVIAPGVLRVVNWGHDIPLLAPGANGASEPPRNPDRFEAHDARPRDSKVGPFRGTFRGAVEVTLTGHFDSPRRARTARGKVGQGG